MPHDISGITREVLRNHLAIKLVGIVLAILEDLLKFLPDQRRLADMIVVDLMKQREAQCIGGAGSDCYRVVRAGLGAYVFRIYSARDAVYDIVVNPILDEWRAVLGAKQSSSIGFVFGEQQLRMPVADEPPLTKSRMLRHDRGNSIVVHAGTQQGLRFLLRCPRPGIAKPKRR